MASAFSIPPLLVLSLLATAPADDADARAHLEAATVDFDAERFEAAAEGFRACATRAVDRALRCRCVAMAGWSAKALDQLPRALRLFTAFADGCEDAGDSDRWRRMVAVARDEVAELEPVVLKTHGRLRVTSSPPGATLRIDGRPGSELGDLRTPAVVYLPTGRHELVASLDGHEDARLLREVAAGEGCRGRRPR